MLAGWERGAETASSMAGFKRIDKFGKEIITSESYRVG